MTAALKLPKPVIRLFPVGPEYLHVSKRVGVVEHTDAAGVVTSSPYVEPHGQTYSIGRNAEKRRLRAGKPRKQWTVAK